MGFQIFKRKPLELKKSVRVAVDFDANIHNLADCSFIIEHNSTTPLNIQFTFTYPKGHASTYPPLRVENHSPFSFNFERKDYGKIFSGAELLCDSEADITLTIKVDIGRFAN